MKLRDIVKLSATMMTLDEVLNGSKIFDETFEIDKEYNEITEGNVISNEEKTIEMLVRCFNLVYSELSTDYIPLVMCENIVINCGSFNLNNLNNNFYKIVKLVDKFGLDVKYQIYDNVLYAKNGEYQLIYCYVPDFALLNDEINNFNGRITDRVFALGLCKEYCYVCGLFDESSSYKTKFEESLAASERIKRNVVMPKRRWL